MPGIPACASYQYLSGKASVLHTYYPGIHLKEDMTGFGGGMFEGWGCFGGGVGWVGGHGSFDGLWMFTRSHSMTRRILLQKGIVPSFELQKVPTLLSKPYSTED